MSPIDQKFFELIVPIATFLTGTLSGIMLAGAKKDDQEAMLQAQKSAQENFKSGIETTAQATKALKQEPTISFGPVISGLAPDSIVFGYKGKAAPPPTPHPEI